MTKVEKDTIIKMLDRSVEAYYMFRDRDDYPDKPCVRREVVSRQNATFNLADYLCRHRFITWEQCCEYWAKVELTDAIEDGVCQYANCSANINGVCKYAMNTQEQILSGDKNDCN